MSPALVRRFSQSWRKGFGTGSVCLLQLQHFYGTEQRVKPPTGNFLNLLLWSADRLARPTFRNLTDSCETWAYRTGLLQRLTRLEQHQLLERGGSTPDARLYRLTAQGRLHALGGRDPEQRWARAWDEKWRLVLWDVPMHRNSQREKLRRHLRTKKAYRFPDFSRCG